MSLSDRQRYYREQETLKVVEGCMKNGYKFIDVLDVVKEMGFNVIAQIPDEDLDLFEDRLRARFGKKKEEG